MGLYFRKSKNLGPIRLNFSKSGIGVSTGIKGARLIFSPNGTYVHFGSNGIYYKKKISLTNNDSKEEISQNNLIKRQGDLYDETKIETTNFDNLTDIGSTDFIQELELKNNLISWTPVAFLTIILAIFSYCIFFINLIHTFESSNKYLWIGLFGLIIIIALSWWLITSVRKFDYKRKGIEIYYELDNTASEIYNNFLQGFEEFLAVRRHWQIDLTTKIANGKYHGGAKNLINRIPITQIYSHKLPNRYFNTNAKIPCISLKKLDLYFFPERLILIKENKVAATMYMNLQIASNYSQTIEQEQVPSDAKVIEYTWKYVNKSGDRDLRFNNNKRLPICSYSDYHFQSQTGINEIISTSKLGGMDLFVNTIKQIGTLQKSFNKSLSKCVIKKHIKSNYSNVYSETSKQLIENKPTDWEFLLTNELLTIILEDLKEKNKLLNRIPRSKFCNEDDVMNLILSDFVENIFARFTFLISNQLIEAYGKPGESGNSDLITSTIFDIHDLCIQLINWEADLLSYSTNSKKVNQLIQDYRYSDSLIIAIEEMILNNKKIIAGKSGDAFDFNIKIKVPENLKDFLKQGF